MPALILAIELHHDIRVWIRPGWDAAQFRSSIRWNYRIMRRLGTDRWMARSAAIGFAASNGALVDGAGVYP